MAKTLTTVAQLVLQATETKTFPAVNTGNVPLNLTLQDILSSGSSGQQANVLYQDADTLDAGNSYAAAYDVSAAGALEDQFGDAIDMLTIRALWIRNTRTTGTLKVLLDGSNAFKGPVEGSGSYVTVAPGEAVLFVNKDGGWPVDGTHKIVNLGVVEAATEAGYEIVIIGTQV